MIVSLSSEDEAMAKEVALARNESQRAGHRRDGKVMKDSLGIDIQGACAELAVSRAFGIDWDGKFFQLERWFDWRHDGHDVSGLEVRSTHHVNGSLIIHQKDPDFAPFILVITNNKPNYKLAGWAFGFEGKRPEYWRDVGYGRPCYYLPQSSLRSMQSLHELRKA